MSSNKLKRRRVGFVLLMLVLFVGNYWTFFIASVNYRVVDNSIWKIIGIAFVPSIIFLIPFYFYLKSLQPNPDPRQSRNFMVTAVVIFLLGCAGLSWGFMITVNGRFDTSTIETYNVKAVDKFIFHYRGLVSNYELKVLWINGKQRIIELSRDEYNRLTVRNGDRVAVNIGKGALGYNWIASIAKSEK